MDDTLEVTASDLYEYRKSLSSWRYKGPSFTIGLIIMLCKVQYTKTLIQQTKIIKTIKSILNTLQRDQPQSFPLFNRDQLNSLRLKLHNLYIRIKEIRDEGIHKREPAVNQGDIIFQVRKDVINIYMQSDDEQIVRTTTDYLLVEQREKYRDILIKEFKKIFDQHAINKLNFRDINFKSEVDIDQKIVELCVNLEKKMYQKNFEKSTSRLLYQDDLKTMIRYLNKDQSGQVFVNLLNGLFPISEAVQLHLVDWTQADKLLGKNKYMAEFDANYYKDIRFKEMTQAQGQICQQCQNPYLYLIDEKQIRRADEPSTKFYECFACGHKYKF